MRKSNIRIVYKYLHYTFIYLLLKISEIGTMQDAKVSSGSPFYTQKTDMNKHTSLKPGILKKSSKQIENK